MKREIIFLLFFICLFFNACAVTPKRPITELCLSYNPQYEYSSKEHRTSPTGYTIGIINMILENKAHLPNAVVSKPAEQDQNNFIKAVSTGLEKIVISKGMTISGPFETYEEMTYPQRSRCDFLVRPHLTFEIFPSQPASNIVSTLSEYSDSDGHIFGRNPYTVTVEAKFDYIILDPLTQEKLELHTFKTKGITKNCDILYQEYYQEDRQGRRHYFWKPLSQNKRYSNCDNPLVIVSQINDELYNILMEKIDNLVSIEEFTSLKKYKEELKQKKVY